MLINASAAATNNETNNNDSSSIVLNTEPARARHFNSLSNYENPYKKYRDEFLNKKISINSLDLRKTNTEMMSPAMNFTSYQNTP